MIYIDSHQHFWQVKRGDYGWLTPDLISLYRDFLPLDLQPELSQLNIQGTILIQAAPTTAETYFLLDLAKQFPFILGVVGWVDMTSDNAPDRIAELSQFSAFCGIRPMIQDISDVNWMLQRKLISCFNELEKLNKTFDALVLPKHLPNLICLVERHPDLKIVINHGAKPLIKDNILEPWATHMKILAEFPQVYCKLSGLFNEAGPNWTRSGIIPYMDHLFSCFGFERMMWGSDYPVVNLVSHYHEWYKFCFEYVSHLSESFMPVFGKVAMKFYNR